VAQTWKRKVFASPGRR